MHKFYYIHDVPKERNQRREHNRTSVLSLGVDEKKKVELMLCRRWRRKILRTNKLQIVVHTACFHATFIYSIIYIVAGGRVSKASSSLTSYFLFPSFLMSNNIANNKLFSVKRKDLILVPCYPLPFLSLSFVFHFLRCMFWKEQIAKNERNNSKRMKIFSWRLKHFNILFFLQFPKKGKL